MFNFAYPNNTDLLKQAFTLKDITPGVWMLFASVNYWGIILICREFFIFPALVYLFNL